jgi:hypothetical protein
VKLARPAAAALALAASVAAAGEADVVAARAERQPDGRYRFVVTVRHTDTGWSQYADGWQVLAPDGSVLATRVLRHPHLNEQPFTRGLSDVEIPEDLRRVVIRARDARHGAGGTEVQVDLPDRKDRSVRRGGTESDPAAK